MGEIDICAGESVGDAVGGDVFGVALAVRMENLEVSGVVIGSGFGLKLLECYLNARTQIGSLNVMHIDKRS